MKAQKTLDKNILATLFLICFICAVFLVASILVNRMTTDSCFRTLDDATAQAASTIRASVESDREQLDVIADLLAQHEDQDGDIIRSHLASFQQRGSLYAIGLLLPDNRLILGVGEENTLTAAFDYSTELAKAPYISGVTDVPENSGKKIIYQAIPMKKAGQTIGILYGFVDLAAFADSLTVTAFDGNAQIYVADGKTGDFLVDTWHNQLGNIFDENILSRKVKPGYDYHEMKMDFVEGKSGHIAFWSNTAGEYFYSCYMSVGVDCWMIQLTVPESIVFAKAIQVRKILLIVTALEILSLAAYFGWVLSRVRREALQKNQQLEQAFFMYDVQQTLFDAPKNPDLFTTALEKVCTMLTADMSIFLTLEGAVVKDLFFSSHTITTSGSFSDKRNLSLSFPTNFRRLSSGQSLVLYPEDIRSTIDTRDQEELAKYHIRNLMIAPVLNSDGELAGILCSLNMKRRWTDSTLLESVSRSFLMAMSSRSFYCQIEQMSMVDAMTGLRNRNCYEHFLDSYAEKQAKTLCCLYIDANGLHELNNSLGHAAGDAMLVSIGDTLQSWFPQQDCYRIGGDEFAVFCTDCSKEELERRVEQIHARMTALGYEISIGEAWLRESMDVKDMVAVAEKRMYEAKRLYYQQSGNLSKARFANRNLEHIHA